MSRFPILSALCLALAACGSPATTEPVLSDEERMAQFMQQIEPGEHHGLLNVMEGTWKALMEQRMSADAPAETYEGVMENRMILGRRFLESRFRMDMGEFGVFEGRGLLGYNTFDDQYESIWIDTMGTAIPQVIVSLPDEDGRGMTGEVTQFDAMVGGEVTRRLETRVLDRGRHEFRMYRIEDDGSEYMEMRISYSRL